jgi:hypothetical protein
MRGAIPPLPNTPSWCGAQLKHRDNFTYLFPLRISPPSRYSGGRSIPVTNGKEYIMTVAKMRYRII